MLVKVPTTNKKCFKFFIYFFLVNYKVIVYSNKHVQTNKILDGSVFIQIIGENNLISAKIQLNAINSTKNNEPFLEDEIEEFEICAFDVKNVKSIRVFYYENNTDSQEWHLKQIILKKADEPEMYEFF